jgi:hypothetical protein
MIGLCLAQAPIYCGFEGALRVDLTGGGARPFLVWEQTANPRIYDLKT